VGDDFFLLGAGMGLEPGSDLGQFRQNLFLLRLDQQCAFEPTKVESQEVKSVVDMDDACFLFIEFQPTLGEPLLDHRDGSFETALVGRRDDKIVSVPDVPEVGTCASARVREPACKQVRQPVERHVGDQGRTTCALWCALRRIEELSVLKIARFQPPPDLLTSREVPESLVDVGVADMESRWGALPAFRRVGFPTALPRTGQAVK